MEKLPISSLFKILYNTKFKDEFLIETLTASLIENEIYPPFSINQLEDIVHLLSLIKLKIREGYDFDHYETKNLLREITCFCGIFLDFVEWDWEELQEKCLSD